MLWSCPIMLFVLIYVKQWNNIKLIKFTVFYFFASSDQSEPLISDRMSQNPNFILVTGDFNVRLSSWWKNHLTTSEGNQVNPCTQSAISCFYKLKNEIQNSIIRFCFYFNKKDKIQIIDYHFHV